MDIDKLKTLQWSYDIKRWLKKNECDKVDHLEEIGIDISKGVISYVNYFSRLINPLYRPSKKQLKIIEKYEKYYNSKCYVNLCRYFIFIKSTITESREDIETSLKKYFSFISKRSHIQLLNDINKIYIYVDPLYAINELVNLGIDFTSCNGKFFFDFIQTKKEIEKNYNPYSHNHYYYMRTTRFPKTKNDILNDINKTYKLALSTLPENKILRCEECLVKTICTNICNEKLIIDKKG